MKRLIKNIFVVGTASLLIYFGIFFLLYKIKINGTMALVRVDKYFGEKYGQHASASLQEFKDQAKYDVIVIGSSHAYRGYDPRIFEKSGFNIYNLGTSAQNISDSYGLAETYVTADKTPFVLLDIYEGTLSDVHEGTFKLIQTAPDFSTCAKLAWYSQEVRSVNLLTYRLFTDYISPEPVANPREIKYMPQDSRYIGKGYVSSSDSLKELPKKTKAHEKYEMNETAFSYLKQTLAVLTSRGIKVILCSHPQPSYSRYPNHSEFVAKVEEVAKPYQVPYFDYTAHTQFNDKFHYYDHGHLNQTGVDLYNQLLLEKISSLLKSP
ncbi:MAG: hypothetical protein ACKVTZ_04945 [Bacteroidia bacterium]